MTADEAGSIVVAVAIAISGILVWSARYKLLDFADRFEGRTRSDAERRRLARLAVLAPITACALALLSLFRQR